MGVLLVVVVGAGDAPRRIRQHVTPPAGRPRRGCGLSSNRRCYGRLILLVERVPYRLRRYDRTDPGVVVTGTEMRLGASTEISRRTHVREAQVQR